MESCAQVLKEDAKGLDDLKWRCTDHLVYDIKIPQERFKRLWSRLLYNHAHRTFPAEKSS